MLESVWWFCFYFENKCL